MLKTKSPEISIIVPVYNVEKYLEECVNSILSQTFRDIEIILVDDGSTDGCGRLCDMYAERDERIQVIHQNNSGASHARNTGIKRARGEYFCFVDSDDLIEPNYCASLLEALKNSNCDYSVCGSDRFMQIEEKFDVRNRLVGILSNTEYLWAQLDRKSEFGFWNKMFRKNIFDRLEFAEGLKNEDVIFSCDLARNYCGGVICISDVLYHYRMNDAGVTAKQIAGGGIDFLVAGRYLIKTAEMCDPERLETCLRFAIKWPWSFVDKIYVNRLFSKYKDFLGQIQCLLRDYYQYYSKPICGIDEITRKRMQLFCGSRFAYGINVYLRLLRLIIFTKILHKDAYRTGHGI